MSSILTQIKQYLHDFAAWEKQYPGPVEHSVQFQFNKHKGHIVFCGLIHGDEVGSLPAILHIIEELHNGKIRFGGKVSFFLGNVPAALKNKRFLEKDLNRSFSPETLDPAIKPRDDTGRNSIERLRALSLMPLLNDCDVLFDFHQTALPSEYPFYAFGFQNESYLWARIAGCTPMFVTRSSKKSFSAAGMCVDEYVRSLGKCAVTLELGQRGFTPLSKQIATLAIKRVLIAGDQFFKHQTTLKRLAHKNIDLTFLVTVHREPFSHPKKRLHDGLLNFTFIHKNQILGEDENSRPIVAPCEGFILFPKYPPRDEHGASLEAQSEIFILAQKLKCIRE